MSEKTDAYSYAPRGMSRLDACRYIGIGVSLFDQMVADGRLPSPKQVNKRLIWDRVALDVAFSALPDQEQDTRTNFQKLIDARKTGG